MRGLHAVLCCAVLRRGVLLCALGCGLQEAGLSSVACSLPCVLSCAVRCSVPCCRLLCAVCPAPGVVRHVPRAARRVVGTHAVRGVRCSFSERFRGGPYRLALRAIPAECVAPPGCVLCAVCCVLWRAVAGLCMPGLLERVSCCLQSNCPLSLGSLLAAGTKRGAWIWDQRKMCGRGGSSDGGDGSGSATRADGAVTRVATGSLVRCPPCSATHGEPIDVLASLGRQESGHQTFMQQLRIAPVLGVAKVGVWQCTQLFLRPSRLGHNVTTTYGCCLVPCIGTA
jgi:hypothetical protein